MECEENPDALWKKVWPTGGTLIEGKCPPARKCEIQTIKRFNRELVNVKENTSARECLGFLDTSFPQECDTEGINETGALVIAKWGDDDLFRELCEGPVISRALSWLRGLFV